MIAQYGTAYLEYGLTERVTIGADYSGSEVRTDKAIAFLRFPLGPEDRPWRYAVEMGVGLSGNEMAVRPAFSIGRGITWGKRSGWLTLDSRALLTKTEESSRLEADFTFGLDATPRSKLILQIQSGLPGRGKAYAKFAPSYVWQRKKGSFYELGVTLGLANHDVYGVKIGTWREF